MLAQSPEGSLRRRKATDEDGPGFGTCIGSRHDHRLPRTAAQSAWQRAPGFASRTVLYLRGTGGHRGKKKRGWTIRAQYEADGVAGQYPRSDVGGVLGSRWGWPPGRAGLIRGVEDFTSSNVVHRAMRQATSATPTQAQSHVASTSPKEVRSDLTVNRSLIDVQQGFFQGKMSEDGRTPRRWRVGHSRSNLRQVLEIATEPRCCGSPLCRYFSHAGNFSAFQICGSFWRSRTTADLLPLTNTSAASARV